MDSSLGLINVAFFWLLLTWVLVGVLRKRRDGGGADSENEPTMRKSTVFTVVSVLSNAIICVSHLGFCLYEFWSLETINLVHIFTAMTWVLAAIITVSCFRNSTTRENKRWPLILTSWWVFSSILSSLSVSVYLVTRLKILTLPDFWPDFVPQATIDDFASLIPLWILLCFNVLPFNCGKKRSDLEHPLLESEGGNLSHGVDPYSSAGIWSKLTFLWLNPLFRKGRVQKLQLHHIPPVPQSEKAETASSLLEETLTKQKTSVTKALFCSVWRSLAINAVFAGGSLFLHLFLVLVSGFLYVFVHFFLLLCFVVGANTIASYMGPFLITHFVNFLSGKGDDSSYYYGLVLALIFFMAKTLESLSQRQWYLGGQRIGIRVRAALMVLVYKKSLSIKYAGSNSGKIINLINVDVDRIGDFCLCIHGVWLLPVQVGLALVILYRNLGAAPSMTALFATVLVMVGNTPLAKRQEKLHSKIMEAKDSRIKATSETLKSMRVLKLHSWEDTFLNKIKELRETERHWLKRYLYTCSAVAFLFWTSPTLVSVITFAVCIVLKTPLTTGRVLSALATFRILQEPIYNLPELISMIAQTKVSMNRIQLFIQEEDQKKLATYPTSESPEVSIDIEVGEYAWTCDENLKSTIKIDERMIIMKGYKVAVCGSVGSGKSSLLCSILGEIPRISGTGSKVYGSKAYVPQSAWIQTGTIRDNVLFGKKINKAFYEDVLEACALDRDIQLWYNGDLSVVGERGMNLSGGQKQRIQLARAIYSESDVYFLDDPFSAVDAHTGAHLFQASNISCSSFSLFFFLVNTKTLKTWNPFAEMSYANLVSEDCHLCHPSAGVLGCFRPCSGKLLEL